MNIGTSSKKSAALAALTCITSVMALSAYSMPSPYALSQSTDMQNAAEEMASIEPASGFQPKLFVPVPKHKPESPVTLAKAVMPEDEKGGLKSVSKRFVSLFSFGVKDEAVDGYAPLSGVQSKLYKQIFDLQREARWDDADVLINKIDDQRLVGHVLAQRFLHPSYRSSFAELRAWMTSYADYPQAQTIYDLAMSRNGSGKAVTKPLSGRVLAQMKQPGVQYAKYYPVQIKRSAAETRDVRALEKNVNRMLRKSQAFQALAAFRASPARAVMDKVEHAKLQSKIAASFLYKGRVQQAYTLASQSAAHTGDKVPSASWVAGLALWQMKNYKEAAPYFENTAASPYASGWLASAGGFWAARSYDRAGNNAQYKAALHMAAKHPRTFYGLLAVEALNKNDDLNWNIPEFTSAERRVLFNHEAGKRAFSLISAGQYALAESELMRLDYNGDAALKRAALAYASHVGLPGLALRLGNMVRDDKGHHYDSAAYPLSPWEPEGGYKVDPAFVHAVVRQESRFYLNARSHRGASGLMQIMPKTAQYVAQKFGYEGFSQASLSVPEKNLQLGQDYITYLMDGPYVKGDVISLLVAYNAGPGNLLKWRKRVKGSEDPLLFMEMMPVKETRDYVEHVLSNYWIYRKRAGLSTPSLASLSKKNPSKYATSVMDVKSTQYAFVLK